VAFDSEHRLVLGVVFGKRSATRILGLLKRVKEQLEDRVPSLITSDEFSSYAKVLPRVWPAAPMCRRDKRSPRGSHCVQAAPVPDPALNYATVCKIRRNRRVIRVRRRVVFGNLDSLAAALRRSSVSHSINTSFLERHNATDRHHNARKQRRSYRFSKDWMVHQAVGYFTYYSYNFCWCIRTLRQTPPGGTSTPRTAAMAAGLADHPWSLSEWLAHPVAGLAS
jgi:IS1 family transposase